MISSLSPDRSPTARHRQRPPLLKHGSSHVLNRMDSLDQEGLWMHAASWQLQDEQPPFQPDLEHHQPDDEQAAIDQDQGMHYMQADMEHDTESVASSASPVLTSSLLLLQQSMASDLRSESPPPTPYFKHKSSVSPIKPASSHGWRSSMEDRVDHVKDRVQALLKQAKQALDFQARIELQNKSTAVSRTSSTLFSITPFLPSYTAVRQGWMYWRSFFKAGFWMIDPVDLPLTVCYPSLLSDTMLFVPGRIRYRPLVKQQPVVYFFDGARRP